MTDYEYTICFLAKDDDHAERIADEWLNRIDRHHWWAFWRRKKCQWTVAFGPKELPDASEGPTEAEPSPAAPAR